MARKAPKTQRERARDRVRELTRNIDSIRATRRILDRQEKAAWAELKAELETLARFEAKTAPETTPGDDPE